MHVRTVCTCSTSIILCTHLRTYVCTYICTYVCDMLCAFNTECKLYVGAVNTHSIRTYVRIGIHTCILYVRTYMHTHKSTYCTCMYTYVRMHVYYVHLMCVSLYSSVGAPLRLLSTLGKISASTTISASSTVCLATWLRAEKS